MRFLLSNYDIKLFCDYHQNFLDWTEPYCGDDYQGPFDSQAWSCEGLHADIKQTRAAQDALHLAAGTRKHDYPSGGWKQTPFEEWPAHLRQEMYDLDKQEEDLAEACRNSWHIIMERHVEQTNPK